MGHPFLQQQNLLLQQQHSQQVKQHIRQAVLQRAGMENVDEETEAKLQQVIVICFYILYLFLYPLFVYLVFCDDPRDGLISQGGCLTQVKFTQDTAK